MTQVRRLPEKTSVLALPGRKDVGRAQSGQYLSQLNVVLVIMPIMSLASGSLPVGRQSNTLFEKDVKLER